MVFLISQFFYMKLEILHKTFPNNLSFSFLGVYLNYII